MIIYPVVPKGTVILRIIPTAMHSLKDVEQTLNAFDAIKLKLDNRIYREAGVENAFLAKS